MSLFATDRHRRILKRLESTGSVRSADLAADFGVTPMTIWRDLQYLEHCGQLKRMRGGAMRLRYPGESAFDEKRDRAGGAKQRIARRVAEMYLAEGDVLVLDGGTTVAALAGETLPACLSLLTNSLPVARAMMGHVSAPGVFLSGGLLRPESGTLIGREALQFFGNRRSDTFLMSAGGLDLEAGVTDPNPREIEVKQRMAARAGRIILMADAGKIGVVSLMRTLPWRRIDCLVTDAPVDHPLLAAVRRKGVAVDCVESG